jgi:crotonobetainyl-CoA:carnitine CoA-transferase CaiB-like acyl-CoA transferase
MPHSSALSGYKVISLALNVPGPVAAKRLREMGAEIIKVEPPSGDPLAIYSADYYHELQHGIAVKKINLKDASGQKELDGLLADADILLTAQRPAALERLNLAWHRLSADFPRLSHIAITGYPHPNENLAGHDLTYLASEGLLSPSHMPLTLFADIAGAERAVSAALAALIAREKTHQGSYHEVALSEAANAFTGPLKYGLTKSGALLGGGFAGYNIYSCSEGHIAIAALEPHFFAHLQELLNVEYATVAKLSEIFLTRSADEWEQWAQRHDVPLSKLKP